MYLCYVEHKMTKYTLTGDLTEDDIPKGTMVLTVLNYSRTSLVVPSSVTEVFCSNNQLTELILPPLVIELDCSNNQLTELILPPSVTELDFDNNQLTELILAASLERLYCKNNIYPEEILLIRGKLSPIRKRIAVRKAVCRMKKQFYRRKENVLNEITSRPSGTVGAWDIGGNLFQENMEEAFK